MEGRHFFHPSIARETLPLQSERVAFFREGIDNLS